MHLCHTTLIVLQQCSGWSEGANTTLFYATKMGKLKEPTKPSHLVENKENIMKKTSYKLNGFIAANLKLPVPYGFKKLVSFINNSIKNAL